MKKLLVLLLAVLMLLSATACNFSPLEKYISGFNTTEPTTTEPATTEPAVETEPAETEPVVTEAPTTESAETEPVETEPAMSPYLETVNWSQQPIYSGPGSNYDYNGTVEVAGVYTIVAEEYDSYGNLWGQLKSGAGWINLTDSRTREPEPDRPLVYAYFTGGSGDQLYVGEPSDNQVRIGFTFEKDLDFTFCELSAAQNNYAIDKELDWGRLNRGQVFVAQVTFWGDMTTYGMVVTDSNRNTHYYAIYMSGETGDLVLQEYTPGGE